MFSLALLAALSLPRVPTHVVCIGDSITAGWGASSLEAGYPARLATLHGPDVEVAAFGAPSTTAGDYGPNPYTESQPFLDATAYLQALPEAADVDVILFLGTNDTVSAYFTPGAFAMEYAARAAYFEALAPHPRLFVVVPPPLPGVELEAPAMAIVAAAPGRVLVDLRSEFSGAPWRISSDGVHPSDAGHMMIARLLWGAEGKP